MKYHRRSIRLNGFDYSNNGYYFVTICIKDRINVFGEIINTVGARRDAPLIEEMKLNSNGEIINNVWKTLPDHNNVILDEFCIMPNHIHFILIIKNINKGVLNNNKGESRLAPTKSTKTLGWIIGMFKTECTKQINRLNKTPGIQLFQRNYFEQIIRNEKEYLKIKEYIKLNPKMWGRDRNNLSKIPLSPSVVTLRHQRLR